jgi:uncharacterized membrane protein
MNTLVIFITSFVSYIILDLLWLGVIIKPFNTRILAPWLGELKMVPALMVYVLLALGLTFFVFPKITSIDMAFLWGALLGLIIYGVYDFTNYATIANWPLKFLLVDWAWGTVSGGLVATIVYGISKLIK